MYLNVTRVDMRPLSAPIRLYPPSLRLISHHMSYLVYPLRFPRFPYPSLSLLPAGSGILLFLLQSSCSPTQQPNGLFQRLTAKFHPLSAPTPAFPKQHHTPVLLLLPVPSSQCRCRPRIPDLCLTAAWTRPQTQARPSPPRPALFVYAAHIIRFIRPPTCRAHRSRARPFSVLASMCQGRPDR